MRSRKDGSLSQTAKAIELRNERSKRTSQRVFSAPLRAFLEHKYPTIYQEYVSLFEEMRAEHPGRKKLVTSETFKRWKADNPKPTEVIPQPCDITDILTLAMRETFDETSSVLDQPQIPEIDSAVSNILEQDDPEYRQASAEIDGIINELIANEDINNVLQQPGPPEDEGIELNPSDEILGDIEPFDYTLEVGVDYTLEVELDVIN